MHGNCNVRAKFITADGLRLGRWVSKQRTKAAKNSLPQRYITKLNKLGFVWDVSSKSWGSSYASLIEFRDIHGHCRVPPDFVSSSGIKLHHWLYNQLSARRWHSLSDDQRLRLNELGFVFGVQEEKWEIGLAILTKYKKKHGTCNVPDSFITKSGFRLGGVVRNAPLCI